MTGFTIIIPILLFERIIENNIPISRFLISWILKSKQIKSDVINNNLNLTSFKISFNFSLF